MNDRARTGRLVLIGVIAVAAVGELAVFALSLSAGRFRAGQVGRAVLTGWLLWRVWDGAGWARWLLAGLFGAAAGLAVALAADSPAVAGRPAVVALLAGFAIVCLACGGGLASPWVGAFQAARRPDPTA